MTPPAPRLFGIVATNAPLVAVVRRGPSEWARLYRWDLAAGRIDAGSWFHGTIPPQKCDLSPDGLWLAYSAVKYPGDWEGGAVYEAISRLPWLTALAAWNVGTTYTRGIHFTEAGGSDDLGEPDVGNYRAAYGLAVTASDQFAVERRRGWVESRDTPPRADGGAWDEHRDVTMTKPQPSGSSVLNVSGKYAAFRSIPSWFEGVKYRLESGDGSVEIDDAQWADWSAAGDLLVATSDGALEVRRTDIRGSQTLFRHELIDDLPDPQPPPPEANHW